MAVSIINFPMVAITKANLTRPIRLPLKLYKFIPAFISYLWKRKNGDGASSNIRNSDWKLVNLPYAKRTAIAIIIAIF